MRTAGMRIGGGGAHSTVRVAIPGCIVVMELSFPLEIQPERFPLGACIPWGASWSAVQSSRAGNGARVNSG